MTEKYQKVLLFVFSFLNLFPIRFLNFENSRFALKQFEISYGNFMDRFEKFEKEKKQNSKETKLRYQQIIFFITFFYVRIFIHLRIRFRRTPR